MLAAALSAFIGTAALTVALRRVLLLRGFVDVPNARSSHVKPMARGGGIAIVIVVLTVVTMGRVNGGTTASLSLALVLGGGLVAIVGLLDDRWTVAPRVRLLVHILASSGALVAVGGLPPVRLGDASISLGVVGDMVACVACVWFLNLFNFMDGIDGIAASEATFVSFAAAFIVGTTGGSPGLVALWVTVGGASLGFLIWNWPPAKIFMGDVGSGFLGFAIALLLVASIGSSGLSLWTAMILVAPFATDATLTLARRFARGEKWYGAHRSHAYQWLSRRWHSHAKVTGLFVLVNLALVLPVAWLSVEVPRTAPLLAVAVLFALGCAALAAGAGRREEATERSEGWDRQDSTK
jgi:Fuc2NAc and GlcNAc transferase